MDLTFRIDVPHETIGNWERGKHGTTRTGRAVARVFDKGPEQAPWILCE
ncbi:MAG: hypothetical protein OXC12_00230 [Spirochaetaceae bacterium]|nr:hypothetical protein [Spirochaetaceae bacterium]